MKITIIVVSLMVLSTLWCADVLAHMDGEIKRHFSPCTDKDPSVDNEQDKQDCIDDGYLGGHGHVDETHDGTTGGEASSWGYWDPCGYAAVSGGNLVNCDIGDSKKITTTITTIITITTTITTIITIITITTTMEIRGRKRQHSP